MIVSDRTSRDLAGLQPTPLVPAPGSALRAARVQAPAGTQSIQSESMPLFLDSRLRGNERERLEPNRQGFA
jgi:hypothetical protein